jgi:glycosyltransferase involved in cell wall biosynthesis
MADRDLRVLLVDLARTFGGAEVRVLAQARGLQDRTAACHVAVLRGSALHSRLETAGLPCEPVAAGRASPALLWALRSLIRRGGYQIVDAHNVQSILWGHFAAALARAPGRVATIHSDYGAEYPGLKGRLYQGVLWVDRLVVRETINVTEVLQAKSEQQGQAAHSTLIHNAVPVPDQPLTHTNPALLREWGFGPGDFVIASIARLKPVKGHTYLIDALARLGDLPHVKLLLVGDGPLRDDLEAQVSASELTDRVRFTGFRQDVSGILQAVDAVCLASLSEGLPYAVLEAGSYARPLLVTAVGGMATLLEDRKTALLVPPRDPEALAEGIRWLVAHPAETQEIGLAAYDLVRRSFSVESMIEQVLQVYHRALRR